MPNPAIGHLACPACDLDAEVRNTAKGKPYITCDDCGYQGFARGEGAVLKLRTKMRPIAAEAAAVTADCFEPDPEDTMPTPKKKPAKKPAASPLKKQEPAPAAPPADDDFETFTGGQKPAKGEGKGGFDKWLNL